MISFIPIEQGNVIGLSIDGKIETSDIEKMTSLVEEKLKTHDKLRAYVELKNLKGISLEAFLQDWQFAWRNLGNFDKKAVVCDANWLNKLATSVSKLFPSIEVKCFSWSEQNQALEWVKS